MNKSLTTIGFLVIAFLAPGAMAADSGPYLVGHWKLQDHFTDGGVLASPIVTNNTVFVFINPTPLTLTLEYAFFDAAGKFCGCDRDTLKPNGRTRYTMIAEQMGGQFSRTLCPGTATDPQTDGVLKTIVFSSKRDEGDRPENAKITVGDAVQAGYQIDIFPGGRTEAALKAVELNDATEQEIQKIHNACVAFIH